MARDVKEKDKENSLIEVNGLFCFNIFAIFQCCASSASFIITVVKFKQYCVGETPARPVVLRR